VPGAGAPGPDLVDRSTTVGEVFVVAREGDGPEEYLVVLADGLAPINQTEAELILANLENPARSDNGEAISLPAGVEAEAPVSAQAVGLGLPTEIADPVKLTGDQVALCATASGDGERVSVTVTESTPITGDDSAIRVGGTGASGPLADVVSVKPGHGSLVQEIVAGGVGRGTSYLVTDEGRRYPIELADAAAFGYDEEAISAVPKGFIALLPTGPALSRAAAATPVDPGESTVPAPAPVAPPTATPTGDPSASVQVVHAGD
jgi:Type VII secretion system ESX-1, transport TM domain B